VNKVLDIIIISSSSSSTHRWLDPLSPPRVKQHTLFVVILRPTSFVYALACWLSLFSDLCVCENLTSACSRRRRWPQFNTTYITCSPRGYEWDNVSLCMDVVATEEQPKCSTVIWREQERNHKLLLTTRGTWG